MNVENTLNTILGAQILLNYHGFDAQREKTYRQLLDLAEALMVDSGNTEKILTALATTQVYLLQMQMHYEKEEALPVGARMSVIMEVLTEEQDSNVEDTI